MQINICYSEKRGEQLWQKLWPDFDIFDCWQVRKAFHNAFKWPVHFIVARLNGEDVGFLPLSRIDEKGYYGCFPGEIWHGKTWLEQNRIPAISQEIQIALWEAAPENTSLRYLHSGNSGNSVSIPGLELDEYGYLFYPHYFNYDYNEYLKTFSGKRRKQLLREIDKFEDMGCIYNVNESYDSKNIEWMLEMNFKNFKKRSYFYDPRFMKGFMDVMSFLSEHNLLRITTIRVMGKMAAVDVGAVYKNQYTLLAGSVDPEFPGIAKVINHFHLKLACCRHFNKIDFLCGDFGWKTRFHLYPRPLYKADKSISY